MKRILFVCHGNICRSPMAEYIMKELVRREGLEDSFHIRSAATASVEDGNLVHPGTKKKLAQENIPFKEKRAKTLKKSHYDKYDLIIGMDRENIYHTRRLFGEDTENKIHLLTDFSGWRNDIDDPWYSGDFDKAYRDILEGCRALLNWILAESNEEIG